VSFDALQPALTDCGLPGIHRIPYGVHMCHFYRTRQDLASAVAPYIAAGLRSKERCLCILPDPALVDETMRGLRDAGVDVDRDLRRGALEMRDRTCGRGANPATPAGAVERWLAKERRALDDGYQGLRIAGNTTFVRPEDWDRHVEYEALFNQRLMGQRIVTLCTYDLSRCAASGVLDVIRNHNCVLDRPDEGWQLLTGAQ
jgi:hypothetical protein